MGRGGDGGGEARPGMVPGGMIEGSRGQTPAMGLDNTCGLSL